LKLKSSSTYFTKVGVAWSQAWKHRSFRIQSIITLITVLSFTFVFNWFFDYIEARHGTLLNDFVLNALTPRKVSWVVFFFLYSGIIFGIYYHLTHPKTILIAFQTYAIVTLVRILTITIWPLEPPVGYLPLREPFVQLFTTGGRIISKDLFFSGHMSTILSLYFASHRKYIKLFLLLCSAMIGSMVLLQHVHYTIDVVFAIPATWGVYYFCRKFLGGKTY
jgi:hypothetical protein